MEFGLYVANKEEPLNNFFGRLHDTNGFTFYTYGWMVAYVATGMMCDREGEVQFEVVAVFQVRRQ